MKWILQLDFKLLVIIVLVGIIVIRQCSGPNVVERERVVTVTNVDTTYVDKETVVTKPGKTIYVDKIIYVPVTTPIDTPTILADYFAKIHYIDTLKLDDSLGTVIVKDTITQNRIESRTYIASVRERTIHRDSTIYIYPTPKIQVYWGGNLAVSKMQLPHMVSGGIILKTKSDNIYQLNLGLIDGGELGVTPFVGGGLYWKIRIKKR
jgi:hypothetical protein